MAKRRKTTTGVDSDAARVERIKKLTVKAIFSDELLTKHLVLKGGNAIDLILQVGTRSSVDLDFSMPGDFEPDELREIRDRIEAAMLSVFAPEDLIPFDVTFDPMPQIVTPDLAGFWGGYRAMFKLISSTQHAELQGDLESLRRNALRVGGGSKLQIDISKFEFCSGKEEHEIEGVRVFVYTPVMLAFEKLRAICQQLPEYAVQVKRLGRPNAPRARDFIDISGLARRFGFDLADPKHGEILDAVFAAKRVSVSLLEKVKDYREFHRSNFAAVQDSVKAGVQLDDFDVYFDEIVRLCERILEARRNA